MATYAEVLPVIGRSFPLLLTYSIPDGMEDRLEVGSQVLISLSGRTAAGYVVSLHSRRPEFENLLPIEAVLDAPLAFTPRELDLARWMADYYCCPLSQALRPFLSEVGAVRVRRQLRLTEYGRRQLESPAHTLKEETLQALEMIRERKGKISRRTLAAVAGARRVSALLRALKEQGLVEETASVISPGGEKRDTLVSLAVGAEQALETAEKLSSRAPRQAAVLSYLARLKSAERTAGTGSAEVLLSEVVRKTESLSAVRSLERKGLVRTRHVPHWRTPWPDAPTDHPSSFELNPQQKAAL
ncbi:MAG: hypothetical protein GTN65_13000, partial [Armatimonadetes bacterium]|nr:hypothetical protein [Armatimonadota bacterium]NIO97975.1 hypothetical protein [Armatimonadota bacterium]